MLKILFFVGVAAAVIVMVNTVLGSNGSKGLFGFLPSSAVESPNPARPLETVPNLIENRP